MKKLLFSVCVTLVVSAFQAGIASAQGTPLCGCGSGGNTRVSLDMPSPTTTYQRFSYEPTPMSAVQPMPVVTNFVEPQPNIVRTAPGVQSYRRYSYQPTQAVRSNGSTGRKERWEYSKTDPRKYR